MEYDEAAAAAKRNELQRAAAASSAAIPEVIRDRVLASFSRVTPPEEPKVTIGLVTISSLYSAPRAASRKPGNVVLNWRKLVDIIPDISLAGLGASTLPVSPAVAAVLAGLYVWNKLWRGSVEDFSDVEAVTILALWQNRNSEDKISEQDGFAKTNELRAKYSLPSLTPEQYAAALNRLIEIDCAKLENGVVWLCESVRVRYT